MITARSAARRAAGAVQQMKGRAERFAGHLTDNDRWRARGVVDQTRANVKQMGARVREAAAKLPERLRKAA